MSNLGVDDGICEALFHDLKSLGFKGEFIYGKPNDEKVRFIVICCVLMCVHLGVSVFIFARVCACSFGHMHGCSGWVYEYVCMCFRECKCLCQFVWES